MAKILLLGATGFLGKHLIKKLDGHDVSCLVRPGSDISHLEGKNLIYGDVTNLEDLIAALKGYGTSEKLPDARKQGVDAGAVLPIRRQGNDAVDTADGSFSEVPQEIIINLTTPNTQDYETNRRIIVDGGRNIIEAAQRAKVRQIIHLSSAAIYRKNLDSYGKAKKEADDLFLNSASLGLSITLLRPTMIYGRGGYVAEKLFSSATKIPFFVFVIGNGKNKIQPVFVDDVVLAIIASIDFAPAGRAIFDLGGPYEITYDAFIKKILSAIHKKKIIIHIPAFLIIFLVKLMSLFIKNLAFNSTTIKRMLEEIHLDTDHTIRELKIKMTDYDDALNRLMLK